MINTTIEINAPLSTVRSVVHAAHPPFVRISTPNKPSSSTSLLRTRRSGLFKAVTPLSPTYPSLTALNPGNQLHLEIGPPFVGANPTVKVISLECDQTSLTFAESAIKQFLSKSQRLDVLLCNAGVMGTDFSVTKDGYEHQFVVNQMAHALMVKMLLPTLQNTASQTGDARIVFESSIGFRWTPSGGIRFDELNKDHARLFFRRALGSLWTKQAG